MCGIGKVNVVPREVPVFPSYYILCRPHLTAMFIKDYWQNKSCIMREIQVTVFGHSLAVDHQQKVVKRTLGGEVVGGSGQSLAAVDSRSPYVVIWFDLWHLCGS